MCDILVIWPDTFSRKRDEEYQMPVHGGPPPNRSREELEKVRETF
ncbi:hypothetical protein TH47_11915 [Thalassospira sp. MCCC 1A02803]|nr:hypothetical protein TH47_11915 [Thalassospira sp. MCCC 1A02803]